MSTRDRILDAAATVMTARGIAATTTRAIAAAAGCSEALLYKHFEDKQQIFLAVLIERMPAVAVSSAALGASARDDLVELTERMGAFFIQSFPMAVSIFGSPDLLREHRDAVRARGFGPEGAIALVTRHFERMQADGKLLEEVDLAAAAATLVGFAFHQAFLTVFDGRSSLPDGAAARAVDTMLGSWIGETGHA